MELIEREPYESALERGFSYIKKGELDKAVSTMSKLIGDDPYLAPAYWGRALCFECLAETQDDTQKAIDDYGRSIVYSKEPSPLSYGRRGILYFKTGRYVEALADLDKALESGGGWAEALFYRGRIYVALARDNRDAKQAVSDFGESLMSLGEPFAPAHFWRAQALRLLGKEKEAVADYERALEIDPDDVLALNALAYCSEHGIGAAKNQTRAVELYEKAAELGFSIAQKNLAWLYGSDGGDAELSAYWMRRAAVSGDAEAQNLYALRRLYGKGTAKNPQNAVYYFELSASLGHLPAACNLADCYEQGLGVEKDLCRALEIYESAAISGSDLAQYNVGRYYYFGIGVPEDNAKAFGILKPLADDGHAGAQDLVGMCYENGHGVEHDLKLAKKYFNLAYKQGNVHAAAHLAFKYRFGRGVKKNAAKAVKLYTLAGEAGLSYAWYSLGRMYFEDKCDYGKAEQAFRLAIDAGEEKISVWLARAIMQGGNPKAHVDEAYSLLQKAALEEDDRLAASIFISEFEFFGFCGWPADPEAAVKRIQGLIPKDKPVPEGLSCAYYFLARAHELGLGTSRDAEKAAELYLKARDAGSEAGGCRCFAAGLAHMLYRGIGCVADDEAADRIVRDEIQNHMDSTNGDIKLMYLWSELNSNGGHGDGKLRRIAEDMLKEEPHDALAAYMLYRMREDTGDGDKYLRKLRKILKTASPYYKLMTEVALADMGQIIYPMLCAGTIDEYRRL